MATFEKEMRLAVEFIPDRLYYVAVSSAPPLNNPSKHFFSIDNEMVYWNFYLDFGPLNLGHVYRYCCLMNSKLNDPKLKGKVIYHYSSAHPHRRANAAFLICAWAMMFMNKTPEEAYKPFKAYPAPFPPWHDATPGVCTFTLTILDTLRGMYKARECRFFDFANFNIEEYEHYEQVENGDLNWYVDGKFIAFAGPHAEKEFSAGGYYSLRPDDYINYFKKKNVQLVVRLNKSYYDPKRFSNHGIDHVDMYFLDGSNPPEPILSKFIQRCEETPGAIAVHCKAGLGRTGTVIGCYIMKHHRFTAEEIIGWLRIVRPGSIIGPQQQFMREMQGRMWREGELFRANKQALPSLALSPEPSAGSSRTSAAAAAAASLTSPGGSESLGVAGRNGLRRDSHNSVASATASGLGTSSRENSSRTTNASTTPVTPLLTRKLNSMTLSSGSSSNNNSSNNLFAQTGTPSTPTPSGGGAAAAAAAAGQVVSPAPVVTPSKSSPFGSRPSSLRNMNSSTPTNELLVSRSANSTPNNVQTAAGATAAAAATGTASGGGASTVIAGYFRKSPSSGNMTSGERISSSRSLSQQEADENDKNVATQGDLLLQRRYAAAHSTKGGATNVASLAVESEYDPTLNHSGSGKEVPNSKLSSTSNGHTASTSASGTPTHLNNGAGTPNGKSFGNFLGSWSGKG